MIGVITSAANSGNVLGYDFGDKRDKDQRIRILGFEGVFLDPMVVDQLNENWIEGDDTSKRQFKALARRVADDLSRQFNAQSALNDNIRKTTGHIALSFSPKDAERLKDDDYWLLIAKEYMDRMDITDTQWVFTLHLDTNAPHGHLAYNRVRFDGSVIDSKNERYRSQKIAREISEQYGLKPAGEAPRHAESLVPPQREYAKMRILAIEALSQSCTMEEFQNQLKRRGIEMRLSEHSGKGAGYGISYSMGDCTAKGSKLDRTKLSYAKVERTLSRNLAARQKEQEKERMRITYAAKIKDMLAGYESIIPSSLNILNSIMNGTTSLYRDTRVVAKYISAETTAKYKELTELWKRYYALNQQRQEARTDTDKTIAFGGALFLMNPLMGLLVIFLGRLVEDIHNCEIQSQKALLLTKVESVRSEISSLQVLKAKFRSTEEEWLREHRNAKPMFNEYCVGLNILDKGINAAKQDLLKTISIPNFVKSEAAAELLAKINETFPESKLNLVSGPLTKTETGYRWQLYRAGLPWDPSQPPKPQETGKSYIDFYKNAKGEWVASIEADSYWDYQSKGVTGSYNVATGKTDIRVRDYSGIKLAHDRKTPPRFTSKDKRYGGPKL